LNNCFPRSSTAAGGGGGGDTGGGDDAGRGAATRLGSEPNPGRHKLSDVAGSEGEEAVSMRLGLQRAEAEGVDRAGWPGSLNSDPDGLLGFK